MKLNVSVNCPLDSLPDSLTILFGIMETGPKTFDARGEENARPTEEVTNVKVEELKEQLRARGSSFTATLEIKAMA